MRGVSWTPAKLRGAQTESDHGHRALQKYKGILLSHCMAARLTLSPKAKSIKVMFCPPCLFLAFTGFPYCSFPFSHPSLVSSPSFLFSFGLFYVPFPFPARSCMFFSCLPRSGICFVEFGALLGRLLFITFSAYQPMELHSPED